MKKTLFSIAAILMIMASTTITASAQETVVDRGDTLWGIGQEYGVSVEDIKDINDLSSNLIHPGQTIQISGQEESNESNESTSSDELYTVNSGDTLWGIGQDYEVKVDSLKSWNDLSSDLIHPGQELVVEGTQAASTNVESSEEEEEAKEETKEETSKSNETSGDDVAKTLTMEATAYTAFCEGCSGTTYTGIDLRANPDRKVIAVDPDVIPLGSEVYVEGYGKAVAGDIGGAIKNDRIDVFIPNQDDALEFGRKDVEVTVYE
ncbi:LysM peptidoglycan-binding domain-containing protein [Halobacillus sp. K22]|uniref:3D domain-containing protein n=1 Tax=Halobacillus sp. K22 TaxID=3457431 RepID=UPI003FCCDE64